VSIQTQWESFREATGLGALPTGHLSELQHLFFAGAFAALSELGNRRQVEPNEDWSKLFGESHRFLVAELKRLSRLKGECPRIEDSVRHVHTRECYDDPGPSHGSPQLICNQPNE
jgi:hypothetical protein